MNSKRFDLGDEALVTYSYGTDRRQPYRRVTICGVFYRGVYDYLGVDATGVVTHLCDAWLAPSKIVIAEEVDLTDLFDGVSFPPMT